MTDQIKRTAAGVPAGGQFASHDRGESTVALLPAPTAAAEREAADTVEPGDVVQLETNTADGPFRYAFARSRALRTAWKNADRPQEVAVVSVVPSVFEPDTDVTVTFDIGGVEVPLDFHQNSRLLTRKARG